MSKTIVTTFNDKNLQATYNQVKEAFGEIEPITAADQSLYFERLVESVVSQQLSVKVADIIFARLQKSVGAIQPGTILQAGDDELRALGLSRSKSQYIKNIAAAFANDSIVPENLNQMSEEEVITKLTMIKGVGRWTAEMFLIFTLAKPDVFSATDYGLKKAITKIYPIEMTAHPSVFNELALTWAPQRSLASRILWKSLEL